MKTRCDYDVFSRVIQNTVKRAPTRSNRDEREPERCHVIPRSSRVNLSNSAFTATTKELPLMEIAPISGRSINPNVQKSILSHILTRRIDRAASLSIRR